MCLGVGTCVPVCLYVCVPPVSELCALFHLSMQIKDEKVIHLLYKEVRGLLLLSLSCITIYSFTHKTIVRLPANKGPGLVTVLIRAWGW